MPFARPTLQELIDRIGADIDLELEGVDSTLRRSNTAVIARAVAGVANAEHGHLDWNSLQIFAASSAEESLLQDGAAYGLTRLPADFAHGSITASGVDDSVIPAGTIWQRSDGLEYASTADAVIAAGEAIVQVQAQTIGSGSNTVVGTALTLSTTIEGITGTALVVAISSGVDLELIEAYRLRVQEIKRRKPAGGNRYDYRRWATSIPGIADAWVISCGQGPGTVDVICLADPVSTGSIYPSAELLATVRAYIVDICPDQVQFLRVLAPLATPLDFSLSVVPNSAAVKAAVAAELADLIDRSADPNQRLGNVEITIPLSQINEAISLAAGETDHTLTLPAAPVTFSGYQLPTMGAIAWA